MTINNPELYNDAWDWAILDGCFGDSKIRPTDIDGITDGDNGMMTIPGGVEHQGCFLWLETKRPGVNLPAGQVIMFEKLAKRGDLVMILWGEKNKPEKMQIFWRGNIINWDTNIDHLRTVVSRWYNHVHKYKTDKAVTHDTA